jgi:hypothetical protein
LATDRHPELEMEIIGNRKYVEIPGDAVHELPPLLLKACTRRSAAEEMLNRAETMVEADALIADAVDDRWEPDGSFAHRKTGLALNLAEQYVQFLNHWCWGESILEWIRQCEITFGQRPNLRTLLKPDVWPHAGRSSFVTLLSDKQVPPKPVSLETAVGHRLTFRQPPPIDFFSDQFLFFLNSTVAANAYLAWATASGAEAASLPPERFHFLVMGTEIKEV